MAGWLAEPVEGMENVEMATVAAAMDRAVGP